MDIELLNNIVLLVIPVIIAITCMRRRTAIVALHFGDVTAKRAAA